MEGGFAQLQPSPPRQAQGGRNGVCRFPGVQAGTAEKAPSACAERSCASLSSASPQVPAWGWTQVSVAVEVGGDAVSHTSLQNSLESQGEQRSAPPVQLRGLSQEAPRDPLQFRRQVVGR